MLQMVAKTLFVSLMCHASILCSLDPFLYIYIYISISVVVGSGWQKRKKNNKRRRDEMLKSVLGGRFGGH